MPAFRSPSAPTRRLVLVVGIGRSGTSAFTGALASLGLHVPEPQVAADATNPKGFGEPQWVVDFQTELLQQVRVSNFDGRPAAWPLTDAFADDDTVVDRLRTWLEEQFAGNDRLVVKDPRTAWLLPVWSRAAEQADVAVAYATMLRPPPEILSSAKKWYGDKRHEAGRLAGWVNVMLHTEEVTRGAPRVFVRYDALLADWREQLRRVDRELGLDLGRHDQAAAAHIDEFIDPSLRREDVDWSRLALPPHLRELAERVWGALTSLAADEPVPAHPFDALRADYDRLYLDAERIAQWSIAAARAAKKPRRAAETLR